MNVTGVCLEELVQASLDQHVVDRVEDLPYTDQDGSVLDEARLRAFLIDELGFWGE